MPNQIYMEYFILSNNILFKIDNEHYVRDDRNRLVVNYITKDNLTQILSDIETYIQKMNDFFENGKTVIFRDNKYEVKKNDDSITLISSISSNNGIEDCCDLVIILSFGDSHNLLILDEIYESNKNGEVDYGEQ